MSRLAAAAAVLLVTLGSPALAQAEIGRTTMTPPAQTQSVGLATAGCDPHSEVWFSDAGLASVRNVSCPTLLPFRPTGKSSGTAIIVAPGGAFMGLAIDKEGWQVARWLARHGVTAFVLKYRTSRTPPEQNLFVDELQKVIQGKPSSLLRLPEDTPPEARADGLAALRWVRSNAAKFRIDPKRVGFMGFSAGGFLTRTMVTDGGPDRPDFAAPIYPNMAAMNVPADAPPMFVAIASDDFLLAREKGFPLIESYRAAKKPVEFHLFPSGGHGFGLGEPGTPEEGWIELMHKWLARSGLLNLRK